MTSNRALQKTKLTLLLFILGIAVYSQNPYQLAAGARQAGLAYTSIATEGFWASFHNQAALGMERNLSFGLNHESRFGIAELSNKTFGLILPTGHGALGAVYSYYGYSEYNRHTMGLSYGLMIGKRVSVGVQTDLYSTRQSGDYQNTNEITFEAGILYRPVDNLRVGLHVYNPLPNSLRNHDLPTIVSLGTGYYFSPLFMASIELEGSSTGSNCVRAGLEYEALNNLFFRGGALSNPFGFSFGSGYSGRVFQVDIGFITHENLGLTPSLSLILFLK
jgi:hypothetical protein